MIANENQKKPRIVILADKDKVEMEDEIRGHQDQDPEVTAIQNPTGQIARMRRLKSERNCVKRSERRKSENYDSHGWEPKEECR